MELQCFVSRRAVQCSMEHRALQLSSFTCANSILGMMAHLLPTEVLQGRPMEIAPIGLGPRPTKAQLMLVYVPSIVLVNLVANGRSAPSLSKHLRASLSKSLDGEPLLKWPLTPVLKARQPVIAARKIKKTARLKVRRALARWMLMLPTSSALLQL